MASKEQSAVVVCVGSILGLGLVTFREGANISGSLAIQDMPRGEGKSPSHWSKPFSTSAACRHTIQLYLGHVISILNQNGLIMASKTADQLTRLLTSSLTIFRNKPDEIAVGMINEDFIV